MKNLITILGILFLVNFSYATDRYWSGGSPHSDNIDHLTNWHGGTNPVPGDNLYFNNTSGSRYWPWSNYGSGSWFDNIIVYSGAGTIRWRGDKTYAHKFENFNNPNTFEIDGEIENRSGSNMEINPVGSGGINIFSGVNVNIESGKLIQVYGSNELAINGNIVGGGGIILESGHAPTVIFNGTNTYTGPTTVNGGILRISSNQSISDLTIDGGKVIVDDGVTLTITGTLTLTSGNIELGTGNIIVDGGSISGESSSSYIETNGNGTVTINNVNAMTTFPVGTSMDYNPVTLTPTGVSNFSVKTKSSFTNTVIDDTKVVNATWDITKSAATSNVTLNFQWNEGQEASGFVRNSNLRIGMYNSSWNLTSTTVSGSNPYNASIDISVPSGTFEFDVLNEAALPVELVNFAAIKRENYILLNWRTLSEENNAGFEIEKSIDGIRFENIGFIEGNGNSIQPIDYTFTDKNPKNGINYYRLKQIDFDGQFEYSEIVTVKTIKQSNNQTINIYPNPVNDKLIVDSEWNGEVRIRIIAMNGQIIYESIKAIDNQLNIDVSQFNSGLYYLQVINNNSVILNEIFVKE